MTPTRFHMRLICVRVLALIICAACSAGAVHSQATRTDRERGRQILDSVREIVKENYYDPAYHGIDLKARFKIAEQRIKEANSNGEIFSVIAQILVEFNDSHLYFLPPDRVARVDYGWRMQMIGDKCFVIAVKPGSTAAANGLKVGDEVYSIDGFEPTRENLWKIIYSYYTLKPRAGMNVVVQEANGVLREVPVLARVTSGKEREREAEREEKENRPFDQPQFHALDAERIIYRLPSFEVSDSEIDKMMKQVKEHKMLVLDLRGNGGGYEKALQRLLGYFFDRDVKIGDIRRRKGTKTVTSKTRGTENLFKGQTVVLVDSNSGSAAELFARVMQIEKRAVVVGDRTAGAVMRSRFYVDAAERGVPGYVTFSVFGVSVTDADITMTDGKSLERVGVTPDELLLPTGSDLNKQRDPVMARALDMLGIKIDPARADKLLPRRTIRTEQDAETEQKNAAADGEN